MNVSWRTMPLAAGVIFILSSTALATADPHQAEAAFRASHPRAELFRGSDDRIERVYGAALATGATPLESAEGVRRSAAGLWGVRPDDLVPGSSMADGRAITGVSWDSARMEPRFHLVSYVQTRSGLPVYEGELRLLTRNAPGNPVVLASANLRDIGEFVVDPALLAAIDVKSIEDWAIAIARGGRIHRARTVIFAGAGSDLVAPRLALDAWVINGHDEWRVVVDAESGESLLLENMVCFLSASGVVEGNATTGIGSEACERALPRALPYVRVSDGVAVSFTDGNGSYVLESSERSATIESTLDGLWFDVFNLAGAPAAASAPAAGGGTDLLFNADNADPHVRAQVNAYVAANEVRDLVLTHNPSYPSLDNPDFTVRVNLTGGLCPGKNAWYTASDPSINFCAAYGTFSNFAFASVISHEYGHHLVSAGGSGQWQYGEGMGDVMSILLLDSPLIGLGFANDCEQAARSADNTCQFHPANCSSCGNDIYSCSLILSGAVWDLRNLLLASDPVGYRETLADLAINSILLHNGSAINAGIAIDFLTLDDDNDDLADGTPHYAEIAAAFALHGMQVPALQPFRFLWHGGVPTHVPPAGTTIELDVVALGGEIDPASAVLHHRVGGGAWVGVPMVQLDSDTFQAALPGGACGQTVEFYAEAETIDGEVVSDPLGGAAAAYDGFIGYGPLQATFVDNFESNLGWVVLNSGSLTDGAWQRGVPVADCDRGAPALDGDGSGACWLTDNDPINCNSDVDGGATLLTSPTLDASVPNAYLGYWRWYSSIEGEGAYQDTFRVQVSTNNGTSWTLVETVGPGGPEVEGGWYYRQLRIDEFVVPTNQFKVRFTAIDLAPASVIEAAVDGVAILSIDCTPPPVLGDLDGDGQVNGGDLGLLLSNWGQSGLGDLDGNGVVDGADLGLLLGNWS